MALDDFLSEDIEPAQPLELPPESAAGDEPAADPSADEDLFDLRTLDELDEPSDETTGGASAEAPAPAAAPAAEVEAPAAATAVAAAPAPRHGGIDLDEDLFDFGSPGDEHLDSLVALGNDLAEVLNEVGAAPSPSEMEGLASSMVDVPPPSFDSKASAAPAPQASPSTGPGAAPAGAPLQPAAAPAPRLEGTGPHSITVVDPSQLGGRPTWLAIGSVIAANFILLFFAWSASTSLHAHLGEVRQELRRGQPEATPELGAGETPEALERLERPAARTAQVETPSPVVLPPLPEAEWMALRVAEQEIADERFSAARRRLYRMLAEADRLEPKTRDAVEARALFLIGDTYARQAAIGEGRP